MEAGLTDIVLTEIYINVLIVISMRRNFRLLYVIWQECIKFATEFLEI